MAGPLTAAFEIDNRRNHRYSNYVDLFDMLPEIVGCLYIKRCRHYHFINTVWVNWEECCLHPHSVVFKQIRVSIPAAEMKPVFPHWVIKVWHFFWIVVVVDVCVKLPIQPWNVSFSIWSLKKFYIYVYIYEILSNQRIKRNTFYM